MLRIWVLVAAILSYAGPTCAQDRVGDAYEIRLTQVSESESDGSSSSSRSGGALVERVVAVRDDGLELEFDLPSSATKEDRARDWQWPARVLRSPDGALHLLNAPDLEARIDAWLTLGQMTREACGHWIFTWNAFKIECDPQSVLGSIRPFNLRLGELHDGAAYVETGGLGPAILRLDASGPQGSTFVAETPIDPDVVRQEQAESDVAVGEITGEPTTVEAALDARAKEETTGVIATTLVTDTEGRVTRRTTVVRMTTTDAEGAVERTTNTQVAERRLLPPG